MAELARGNAGHKWTPTNVSGAAAGNATWNQSLSSEQAASNDADTGLGRIMAEMVFFVCLAAISEMVRLLIRLQYPNKLVLRHAMLVCSLVLGWYSTSITLVLLNKWVIDEWHEDGMPFPVFYSMNHMFLKGIFALSYHVFVRCEVPRASRKVVLGTAAVGACTGLDVALSNLSLGVLSASFYTMLKSCSMIFVLILGVALQLEPCSCQMLAVVLAIASGLVLTSYGEVKFDWWGFACVLTSELLAAVRWLLTQMLLKGDKKLDAIFIVLYVSPGSTLSLAPVVAVREWADLGLLLEPGVLMDYVKVLLLPGVLAFTLLLVEVQLVAVTSSLTMAVFGNLKSIIAIIFAIVVFGEEAGLLQWIGLMVALSGIFCYSYLKQSQADGAAEPNGKVAVEDSHGDESLSQEEDDSESVDATERSPLAPPMTAKKSRGQNNHDRFVPIQAATYGRPGAEVLPVVENTLTPSHDDNESKPSPFV